VDFQPALRPLGIGQVRDGLTEIEPVGVARIARDPQRVIFSCVHRALVKRVNAVEAGIREREDVAGREPAEFVFEKSIHVVIGCWRGGVREFFPAHEAIDIAIGVKKISARLHRRIKSGTRVAVRVLQPEAMTQLVR
jgi:hypothetical protein